MTFEELGEALGADEGLAAKYEETLLEVGKSGTVGSDAEAISLAAKAIVQASGAKGSVLEGSDLVARAASAAGWDFAALELRDAVLEGMSVDDAELAAVSGGEAQGDTTDGGCTENLYKEKCADTVKGEGLCWSDDMCLFFSKSYHCVSGPSVDFGDA